MSKRKDISAVLLGFYVALILWITVLHREPLHGTPIVYKPFHAFRILWESGQLGAITDNFLGNIVLFVPVGVLFPIMTNVQKHFWVVGVGLSFSILIEITQLITSRGCFDIDDFVLNTIGTAIGFIIWKVFIYKKTADICK